MLINTTLDIEKGDGRFSTLDNPIVLRQNDAEAYVLSVGIRQSGAVLDLAGYTVRFYALRPDGGKVIDGDNVEVSSAPDGLVSYSVPAELTSTPGDIPTAYFRITSGSWSASTGNIAIRVIPGIAIEASGGDYLPEIDALLNAMEAQRVSYASAEDVRAAEWSALVEEVIAAGGRANSAADTVDAFLKDFSVEYSDMTEECKQIIASSAAAGVTFATKDEIDEAFEQKILPVIGGENQESSLTQEDYDWALGKIFG